MVSRHATFTQEGEKRRILFLCFCLSLLIYLPSNNRGFLPFLFRFSEKKSAFTYVDDARDSEISLPRREEDEEKNEGGKRADGIRGLGSRTLNP